MRNWFKEKRNRYRIAKRVAVKSADLGRRLDLDVRFDDHLKHPYDCRLERTSGTMRATFGRNRPAQGEEDLLMSLRKYLACYALHFDNCDPEVRSITVAIDDGNFPSEARFAASVNTPSRFPLPDPYFTARYGFAHERDLSDHNNISWTDRSSRIVWRGGANGAGRQPVDFSESFNPDVIVRLRLAMILSRHEAADAGITFSQEKSGPLENLERLGLTGSPRPEHEWLGDKFAIDIDGWTNAWSNLPIRLHFGCCVLKVASQFGYRQWYYDKLVPWQHYIPVRADMSDLLEKIDWARSHDTECKQIAENGRAFIRAMTFESECTRAVEIISTHWNH